MRILLFPRQRTSGANDPCCNAAIAGDELLLWVMGRNAQDEDNFSGVRPIASVNWGVPGRKPWAITRLMQCNKQRKQIDRLAAASLEIGSGVLIRRCESSCSSHPLPADGGPSKHAKAGGEEWEGCGERRCCG